MIVTLSVALKEWRIVIKTFVTHSLFDSITRLPHSQVDLPIENFVSHGNGVSKATSPVRTKEARLNQFLSAYDPTYESNWFSHKLQIIESNFPDDPTRPLVFIRVPSSVLDLESAVSRGIRAGEYEFGGILLMQGTTDNNLNLDRFTNGNVLGLSGDYLRQRCIIVRNFGSKDDSEWMDNIRMDHFEGTQDSARAIMRKLLGKMRSQFNDYSPEAASNAVPHRALAAGRNSHDAVVLLVGQSGHGKSKTINRLVGQSLLLSGNGNGSRTKTIQRVKFDIDKEGTPFSVSFVDTPGYADTTYTDRELNNSLISLYKQKYFPDVPSTEDQKYPNVILLITEWNSIHSDSHNSPNFTSAIGKSMWNLKHSGLIDPHCSNVIVVVTKSLSSLTDECPEGTASESDRETWWRVAASKRRIHIEDLRQTIFPRLSKWPIVFIENGSDQNLDSDHKILPNEELSHQNLFKAIFDMVSSESEVDASGLITAEFLTGCECHRRIQMETLVEAPNVRTHETGSQPDISQNLSENSFHPLVLEYLGVTCNLKEGQQRFKKSCCVLDLARDKTLVLTFPRKGHYAQEWKFARSPDQASKETKFKLGLNLKARHVVIDKLPPLSESKDSMSAYHRFYDSHGTHVIVAVALGGIMQFVRQDSCDIERDDRGRELVMDIDAPVHDGINAGAGAKFSSAKHIDRPTEEEKSKFFSDGGGSAASRIAADLSEKVLYGSGHPSVDSEICMQWMKAVEDQPVFCPDAEDTLYTWIYECDGLTDSQKSDLMHAAKSYFEIPEDLPAARKPNGLDTGPLPRRENERKVVSFMGQQKLNLNCRPIFAAENPSSSEEKIVATTQLDWARVG
ncbi:hypothetical protein K435DRAFT_837135 [Dendrothele bispora CBS 962.96]|uniref:G domain-containing protein n=1 Tax=Dendrothele bispora (strain CBS 962.96) TaxID=1314807 RepID=A0A4S8MFB7_DENBC|nr:hypothetical protein K435DRAFT_837135 [Dendrothele bispora CBS 962.96]